MASRTIYKETHRVVLRQFSGEPLTENSQHSQQSDIGNEEPRPFNSGKGFYTYNTTVEYNIFACVNIPIFKYACEFGDV